MTISQVIPSTYIYPTILSCFKMFISRLVNDRFLSEKKISANLALVRFDDILRARFTTFNTFPEGLPR